MCGRGAEKFIQGKKKGPARSPEAKTVILAESYSKIWKGLWAIWADGNPSPLPPRTAFQASVLLRFRLQRFEGPPHTPDLGVGGFKWPAATAADPKEKLP